MIIYHNASIFIHLLSCDSGDVWSLIFNHGDLNTNPLTCSLGCAVTLSSGKGHRYPTIHFAYLSTKKLSLEARTLTKDLLRLHSEHIIISAKNLDLFLNQKMWTMLSKTNSAPPLQKRLLLTLNGMIQIRTYYL